MKKTLQYVLAVCLIFVFTAVQPPENVFADADTGTIRIVHTNDTHGRYAAGEDTVGYARLQTIVNGDGQRADLILDAGDAFHGLPFATVERGGAIAELFKAVGYTAMTPGNHDFNYGYAHLAELGTDSGTPVLSCNVLYEDTEQPVFTPSVGLSVQGFRVGLIGVTSPDIYGDTAPSNVEGLVFADPAEYVQKEIDRLHSEGCTVIIVLAHMGDSPELSWTSERLVSETTGIDVVIDGHTHDAENRLVNWKDGEGQALCVQTGAYFENVGVLTLTVDRETGRPVDLSTDCEVLVSASQAQELEEDAGVAGLVEGIEQRQSAILGNVIASSPQEAAYSWEAVRCGQTAVGTVVCDAYLAETGADLACENAGGISVTWDPDAADGSRVVEVRVGKRVLDPEKTYVLATNNFVAASGDYPALAAAEELNQYGACDELILRYLSGQYEDASDWTVSLDRTVFTEGSAQTESSQAPSSAPASSKEPETVSSAVVSSEAEPASDGGAGVWIAVAAIVVIAAAAAVVVVMRRRA